VWDIRVRNLKQQNPNGEIKMATRDFKDAFVWPPFTCATTAHFLSSSSCGSTSASNHFDLQAIHKKNSQNRTMKTGKKQKPRYGSNCIARTENQYFWCPSDWFRADEKVLNAVWQLQKARWKMEQMTGFPMPLSYLWLFVILFSFHCISCFSNKSIGGVVG